LDKFATTGDREAFNFPEPEIKGLDYSFSGSKTAILYFLQRETQKNPDFVKQNLADICASVQWYLVRILLKKLKKAVKEHQIYQIAIAGGVSANSCLRAELQQLGVELGVEVFIPKFEYCTDNAAMIACAAHYQILENKLGDFSQAVKPRWEF
ncbi:MAG: carbamoyltransferase N-terminal domain-containing protein, partial [Cytophagales bacterium]